MSATTNTLAEMIDKIEEELHEARSKGDAVLVDELMSRKVELSQRLTISNKSLSEGKKLLQG